MDPAYGLVEGTFCLDDVVVKGRFSPVDRDADHQLGVVDRSLRMRRRPRH